MPKRPRDPNQLAKLIVDIATGEVEDTHGESKRNRFVPKGRAGGVARAKSLSAKKRSSIAAKAAKARWAPSAKSLSEMGLAAAAAVRRS